MANNVTMSFANIVKNKEYNLFHGNILKVKKLRFGKEIDFPTKTAIPTIQKKLRENGSAPAAIETNEERSFFLIDIPCHPDFVGDDLSQVVSQVEHADIKELNASLSQVVSQVKGADLEQVVEVFISLQKAMSMAEWMQMFRQVNRTRFKRTCLDILIKTGLATPTVPDKPNSRFQKYVLTEKGKSLIESVNKQKGNHGDRFL